MKDYHHVRRRGATAATSTRTRENGVEGPKGVHLGRNWFVGMPSLAADRLTAFIAIFANVFLSGFDGTVTASTYAVIGSEFNAANTASWLTTSYLITSTAFQPLYGRFSDLFGRRACFFTSTLAFMFGCLGCAVSQNIILLNLMRALTGLGGGGLMTMGKEGISKLMTITDVGQQPLSIPT